MPVDVAQRAQQLRAKLNTSAGSSRLHKEVSSVLTELGVQHQNEHSIAGLQVDIALLEQQIAVEVDGPTHFTTAKAGSKQRLLGTSQLKRRLLRGMGWRVVSVPYYEWDELRTRADKGK